MSEERIVDSVTWEGPATYRIRVGGSIDPRSLGRLGGLEVDSGREGNAPGATTLVGRLRDQAALSGVLNALYEMHLPIISVQALSSSE